MISSGSCISCVQRTGLLHSAPAVTGACVLFTCRYPEQRKRQNRSHKETLNESIIGILAVVAAIFLAQLKPRTNTVCGFATSTFHYGRLLAVLAVALGAYLILHG